MQRRKFLTLSATAAAISILPLNLNASDNKKTAPKTLDSATAKQIPEHNYNLKPKQISENIWCFFGVLEGPSKQNAGNMLNTCYIKGDNSFIIWDSGPSYIYAKQAYEAISKIVGKLPVKHVFISHEHDDHWLGNNYYKEVHGAEIIGPESINKNYKVGQTDLRMFKSLNENAIRGTKIIHVDKSYKESVKLNIAGVDLEYIYAGNAHSEEDFFMYLPKTQTILAADLVFNGRITSNRHGCVENCLAALDAIDSKEWTTLIPGHGFIIDKTATDEIRQYFTLLGERVQGAIDDGVDSTEIVEKVPLEEFKDKAMYGQLNSLNVSRAFLEFDMGLPELE